MSDQDLPQNDAGNGNPPPKKPPPTENPTRQPSKPAKVEGVV